MFAKAVVDFDEIEACAYSGSELYNMSCSASWREVALGSTYYRQYDSSIIPPKLMHNPHAGNDPKEKEDQDDYEEGDGESEDSGTPITLVAGHFCVLPSRGKVRVSCLRRILEKRREGQMKCSSSG